MAKIGVAVVVGLLLIPPFSLAQPRTWFDSLMLVNLGSLAPAGSRLVSFRVLQEADYSISCSGQFFCNRPHEPNLRELLLLQHIRYQLAIIGESRFKINNSFVQDLGVECFIDSITRFQPDENTMITRAEINLTRHLLFSFFSQMTTRLFNTYVYSTGPNGNRYKVLNGSFLTPLLWTFSGGPAWTLPGYATLDFGVTSGKITWIRNRGIYDQLKVTSFYGVPKGKNHAFEFGLSMHMLVDHNFTNRLHWNCDLLLFKNYLKPIDLTLTNLIGIKINKILKTSIRTHVSYESAVSKTLQVENLITLGFRFTF